MPGSDAFKVMGSTGPCLYLRPPHFQYRLSAIPAFKYYEACTFLVFLSNFIIQMLVTNR